MKVTATLLPLGAERKEQWLSMLPDDCRPEEALFWDIETTGLSRIYDSVYLIGYLYYQDGEFYLEQHLAEHIADEVDLLLFFLEKIKKHRYLISFNGDTFDLPFLCERMKRMHIREPLPETKSLDLFRLYRPYQRFLGLPNGKLKTLERFLGIERQDVMTGGELIEVFYEYSRTDDPGLERVLLLHNYDDVLHLPDLLALKAFIGYLKTVPLHRACLSGPASSLHAEENDTETNRLYLWFEPDTPPPLLLNTFYALKKNEPSLHLIASPNEGLFLGIPAEEGTLRHYLPNYKDYYVLPDGRLIHKSLDRPPLGRRASKEDAFLSAAGTFLYWSAAPLPESMHLFRHTEKEKAGFISLAELSPHLDDPAFADSLFHSYIPSLGKE